MIGIIELMVGQQMKIPVFEYRTDFSGYSNPRIKTGWVWALGKTFHSGYLNIPINLFIQVVAKADTLAFQWDSILLKKINF